MKFNLFQTTVMTVSVVAAVYSIHKAIDGYISAHENTVVIQENPVAALVTAMHTKGKLMAPDVDIRTDTTGIYQSSVFDAKVSSWKTARVQTYIEPAKVSSSWITHHGDTLNITIPKDAIEDEIIYTGEDHITNGSWLFFMDNKAADIVKRANEKVLIHNLNEEAKVIHQTSSKAVADQLQHIATAFEGDKYKVTVTISM